MALRLLPLILAILFSPITMLAADLTDKVNEVKKTGKCSYEITVKIVLHSWPGENNVTDELIDRWKKGIESKWNGPSKEVVEAVARVNGLNPGTKSDIGDLVRSFYTILPGGTKMDQHVRKLLQDEKVSCMMINCCEYKIKATIKKGVAFSGPERAQLRGDLDAATSQRYRNAVNELEEMAKNDGFHHVVVVPGDHRSFVHGSKSQVGFWGENADGEVAAHEAGHQMKIDDHYAENAAGKCEIKETGKNDLMGQPVGWPSTKMFNEEMLKKYGIKCDCCKDQKLVDGFWQRLNITIRASMDAILTCNREVLEQALQHLTDQKQAIEASLIPLSEKKPLISRLDDQMEKIRKALRDCPEETVIIDSGAYCEHWPWETPGGIFFPDGGTTPPTTTGTPTPDGSTPPETPTTPETPVTIVPGSPLFPFTMIPEGIPPTTPEEEEKPKTPPTTYAKVEKSVIEDGKAKSVPVVGIKMKFSKLAPPLPTKGNPKVDEDFDKDPDIAVSDSNGNIKRKSGKQTMNSVPEYMQQYAAFLDSILGVSTANAAARPTGNSVMRINYAPIESYILRIKIDRSKKDWDRPATYLGANAGRHVIRSWVLNDILYAVINIRKEPE